MTRCTRSFPRRVVNPTFVLPLWALVVGTVLAALLSPERALAQTITCAGRPATIVGTAGADVLFGTAGDDVIVALGGRDRIYAGGGNDVVCGGDGRDFVHGGPGRDLLNGGRSHDRLVGGNGGDRLLGGAGRDILKGGLGSDRIHGGAGVDRCVSDGQVRLCPGEDVPASLVLHVSIDGLRSDFVNETTTPNLHRLRSEGASTLRARTEDEITYTLPGHISQLTGLSALGDGGHGVDYNEDRGDTIHDSAGRYVPSVFDLVHDRGGATAMLVGKEKFFTINRSWNDDNGAPDTTGPDDGTDKVDRMYKKASPELIELALIELERPDLRYLFLHLRDPDSAGHAHGWATDEYAQAVTQADRLLGIVLDAIRMDAGLALSTAVIVVSDHGGPTNGTSHSNFLNPENHTIPLIVWGPGVGAGKDLYDLNPTRSFEDNPIRMHDVANTAMHLLRYQSVPGSTHNVDQRLAVR